MPTKTKIARIDLLWFASCNSPRNAAEEAAETRWLRSLGWVYDTTSPPREPWWFPPGLDPHGRPFDRVFDDIAASREANLELQRRLLALGWMCDCPEQSVGGQRFAAPGTWTLAGVGLPRTASGRLGARWKPAHGRCFVNAKGRIVLGARVRLEAAVARAGDSVRFLEIPA